MAMRSGCTHTTQTRENPAELSGKTDMGLSRADATGSRSMGVLIGAFADWARRASSLGLCLGD